MSVIVTEVSAPAMRSKLHESLHVYVAAMGYPRGIEHSRAPMWAEHILRRGWRAMLAFDTRDLPGADTAPRTPLTPSVPPQPGEAAGSLGRDVELLRHAPIVGVAYGYHGEPAYWWDRQVRAGIRDAGLPADVLADYFELTELHVLPSAQGCGVGLQLLTGLLAGAEGRRVLLSTPEVPDEDNRAWRLYRRTGFTDVLRGFRFLGDGRRFAVLGRPLPLQYRPDPGWNSGPQ